MRRGFYPWAAARDFALRTLGEIYFDLLIKHWRVGVFVIFGGKLENLFSKKVLAAS